MSRSLFDPPPSVAGSATSHKAAESIRPKAAALRRQVFDYIATRGWAGATRQEIEAALGISGNTVRPRVVELVKAGMVIETNRSRKTSAGRLAAVLVTAEWNERELRSSFPQIFMR